MGLRSLGRVVGRIGHAAATTPAVAEPGYRVVTAAALAWGVLLGGHVRRVGELTVVSGLPRWAFGRGGTTVGATFLTRDAVSPAVLRHEEVHRQQWRRHGLAFIPLYVAAGLDPTTNRWEVEAGLADGGYR